MIGNHVLICNIDTSDFITQTLLKLTLNYIMFSRKDRSQEVTEGGKYRIPSGLSSHIQTFHSNATTYTSMSTGCPLPVQK